MPRDKSDPGSRSSSKSAIRTNFYREEFLKHQQCLRKQREFYSQQAIAEVESALSRIMSGLEQLCKKQDADVVVSRLLRKFDVVTRLSAWTDPKNVH